MSRQFVALILPLIFNPFIAAQQVSTSQNAVARQLKAIPAATSTTAYDRVFMLGCDGDTVMLTCLQQ
jgi:hypothetical protein